MLTWDAIVVGGGHNGLVAASYLGRAGWRVLVLERLGSPGGAAVDGYAYLVSLLPERIRRDLGLRVELRSRRVSAFAPPDLLLRDAGAGPGRALLPTLLEPLPDERAARRLLGGDAWLADRPLGEWLRERYDDGLMRGVVSSDGLIGTFTHSDDESLRQNRCFLWHVMGEPWRVPVGGMGAVSRELAQVAAAAGAAVRCGAEVVGTDGSEVTWRQDGEEHTAGARYVLAGVAPAELARLRGLPRAGPEPEGSQFKLNLALDRLPRLRSGVAPEDAFAGTFRLNEHEDQLASAYRDAAAGRLPATAPAEVYCHTLTDPSIAPDGTHRMSLFGIHTPARLFRDDNDAARAAMRERYLDALDEHLADPIRDCIARDAGGALRVDAKTPLDVEHELHMPGGNIFHGDLRWPWAEDPADAGRWGVETDDPRILICGAGARRGGCVSGIGGHNAAMALLRR